jgi:NAD+ diphosphatase
VSHRTDPSTDPRADLGAGLPAAPPDYSPDPSPDPAPPIALSQRAHDRVGARRTDQAWLDQVWGDPETRVLPMSGSRFPVDRDDAPSPGTASAALAWVPPDAAPPGRRVFLGLQDDRAHFAVLVEESEVGPAPQDWVGFRAVGPELSADDAGLLVHAVALAEWHRAHRFCPRCGNALESRQEGHVLECTGCGRPQFPRADPAVIMLVTDASGERALLGRQPSWPEGRYSTLAGFVDPGESLEQAVVREVAEEVGVEVGDVRYFGNQPWPFPASLMVGFFARARTHDIDVDGDEISHARWFSREEIAVEAGAGTLLLPGGISISRSLVEAWYGGPLPGSW